MPSATGSREGTRRHPSVAEPRSAVTDTHPLDPSPNQVFLADEMRFTGDPFDALIVAAARSLDLLSHHARRCHHRIRRRANHSVESAASSLSVRHGRPQWCCWFSVCLYLVPVADRPSSRGPGARQDCE
jgi:hypothetical protein